MYNCLFAQDNEVYCGMLLNFWSQRYCVWAAKMFYLWWIWDKHYSFTQGHAVWLSEHAQFCLCISVCVHLYEPETGGGWGVSESWTLPAVFSVVDFHLRVSKSPLHFPSHTLHLYLEKCTQTKVSLTFRSWRRWFAVLYCRLQHKHKSCDYVIYAVHTCAHTQRTKKPASTSLLVFVSISSGLRHRTDSSAAYFKISSVFTNTVHFVPDTSSLIVI